MVGEHISLAQKFQHKADRSFVLIRCIMPFHPHCCQQSCNEESQIPGGSSAKHQNSKRQAQVSALQEFLQTEKRNILRPCETRWLVLYACVERVLKEWETLRLLLLQSSVEDRIVAAQFILNHMNYSVTEAYFRFMKFVLKFFNRLRKRKATETSSDNSRQRESTPHPMSAAKFCPAVCSGEG
ncbi:hypothetical protein HPB48_023711 [Haemaphysalis longicornis]|uniref:Uncharacterized protein n=1 Tax=Haemaphysalis longicornis TaxID=44386 RepID=A0A9J6H6N8_HAELO|nr:hypothetical protein HPB48_023711 [Haemaphysalis longicornis]